MCVSEGERTDGTSATFANVSLVANMNNYEHGILIWFVEIIIWFVVKKNSFKKYAVIVVINVNVLCSLLKDPLADYTHLFRIDLLMFD